MEYVIIGSEWYVALYLNGSLYREAKPDYLHAETLHTLWPEAPFYWMDYDLYDELIMEADGYPEHLDGLPLERMEKLV